MLTVPEVAARLRVTTQTVYNKLQSGVWHGVKVGREWRVSVEEVERLEKCGEQPVSINLEAWEPCSNCYDLETLSKSVRCWPSYCPICGRPLTERAWEQLEKHIKEMLK